MMPTYEELQTEKVWRDQTVPHNLSELRLGVIRHFEVPPGNVGIFGNNRHLRGYHRSRAWVLGSRFCTNRTYSIARTAGDKRGGNDNWITAIDIKLPRPELVKVCRRIDKACRAGRLEKITEWYGNLGGDTIVDGWDNISNRPAKSDSSHLDHLHLSLDRGRANEDHGDLLAVITGQEPEGGDRMSLSDENAHALIYRVEALSLGKDRVGGIGPAQGEAVFPTAALKSILARLERIESGVAAIRPTDPEAFVTALIGHPDALNALTSAMRDQLPLIPTAQEIARSFVDIISGNAAGARNGNGS